MYKILFIFMVLFTNSMASFGQSRNIGIGDISVIELAGNGNAWVGSNGNGLIQLNTAGQVIDTFYTGNTPQLKSDSVTAILDHLSSGVENVFVGTKNGLACSRGATWDTIGHVSGMEITGLLITAGDSLWVLTANNGVFIFDSTGTTFLGALNTGNSTIPTNLISTVQRGTNSCGTYCIATSQAGCFWTANGTTYTLIDTSAAGKRLVDNRVTTVYMKNDCSARLIGTQGGYSSCPPGLACTNFTTTNGLPQNYITAIGEDCTGKVWLGTHDSGVIVYNPRLNATTKFIDVFNAIQRTSYWLTTANNGLMYGINIYDGFNGQGMLFNFNPVSGTGSILFSFDSTVAYLWNPVGNVVAVDSILYGLTRAGGFYGKGTVFSYNVNRSALSILASFNDSLTGGVPVAFIQAKNGYLYGVTSQGGTHNYGTLFKFDPVADTIASEYAFDSIVNGAYPDGNLTQGATGKIYGSTPVGGAYNKGTLFQFDPGTNAYQKLYDFQGAPDGDHPSGPVIRASDGFLYGTTQKGGSANSGILFAFDTVNSSINKLHEFDLVQPTPVYLYQAANGIFYGLTQDNNGTLFQFNRYNGIFNTLFQFDTTTGGLGSTPYPNLAENPQGNVFGRTLQGGSIGIGTIFQFNPQYAEFEKYTTANGLASNQVTAIALDPNNCAGTGFIGTADGNIAAVDTAGNVTVISTSERNIVPGHTGVYLYPQPTSSQFQFVFSRTIPEGMLYITDIYGQKIQQYEINNQQMITADASMLAAGIYFFYVINADRVLASGKVAVAR